MYWTSNSQPVANAISFRNQGGLRDIFSAALEIWRLFFECNSPPDGTDVTKYIYLNANTLHLILAIVLLS